MAGMQKNPLSPLGVQLGSVASRYRLEHSPRNPSTLRQLPGAAANGAETAAAALPTEQLGTRLSRLEAVLCLAREPLSTRKLAKLADLADGTEAQTLLKELERRYDEGGYAFQVSRLAGGCQLLTRPQFAPWLRPHTAREDDVQLSDPAMETLAVVAYRQPVLRADVEAIRGVQCGELLRQLMDRELLRIVGRSEELGRPFFYGTTKRFLQVFGLRNLDELPRAAQLRPESQTNDAA